MFDFFFDGTATGSVDARRHGGAGELRRHLEVAAGAARDQDRAGSGGVPVSVSVEPPRESAPDPAKQGGTLDPVSAGFRLFRDGAGRRGLRHHGRRLRRLAAVAAEGRRSRRREGEALVCAGTFARIEGEAHSMADLREFPFRLVFVPNGGGLYRLERIEAPTNFGQAVLTRQG